MIIVGGTYREICAVPHWDRLLGSGGRAAIALSKFQSAIEFFTYAAAEIRDDIAFTMQAVGIQSHIQPIEEVIAFSYFHPLSRPQLSPTTPKLGPQLKVDGDAVLYFGFVEGDAVITAGSAVYDPQGGAGSFQVNGSSAKRLAVVLNAGELLNLTQGSDLDEAAKQLLHKNSADVVVVKRGPKGASVYQTRSRRHDVPAYKTDYVFKIGSGDIFSAMFAHQWMVEGASPVDSAYLASKAVAEYVDTKNIPLDRVDTYPLRQAVPQSDPGMVYLAGPFFTTAQRWLIDESLNALTDLGVQVFSPFHDVGFGTPHGVARADLEHLEKCSAVFAIMDGADPGTLFEIGYARSRGIPVVVLAENVKNSDKTMYSGSGCDITDDFASAIYKSIWAATK